MCSCSKVARSRGATPNSGHAPYDHPGQGWLVHPSYSIYVRANTIRLYTSLHLMSTPSRELKEKKRQVTSAPVSLIAPRFHYRPLPSVLRVRPASISPTSCTVVHSKPQDARR